MGKSKHRGARSLSSKVDAKRSARVEKKTKFNKASRLINASQSYKDRMNGSKVQKGLRGEVSLYVSRAKAMKRLQVSIKDFRRLCILKGVYPRQPGKQIKHSTSSTFYHARDVGFLANEPLLQRFRDSKAFMKKVRRHLGKNDKRSATLAYSRRPNESLDHLVRERYPKFELALEDLPDALCLISMFASLPSTESHEVDAEAIADCARLLTEFLSYCVLTRALKSVFVSLKGTYYEIEIEKIPIVWLVPHAFSTELPDDVDYRVMSTFLAFYRATLSFVNFRLFRLIGLASYPPSLREIKLSDFRDADFVKTSDEVRIEEEQQEYDQVDAVFSKDETVEKLNKARALKRQKTLLFEGLKFLVSREVPSTCVVACAVSHGGSIVSRIEEATHVVTDRTQWRTDRYPNVEFVQPQWLFDCVNFKLLLPTEKYLFDSTELPPHLSPFVDDELEGHVPQYAKDVLEMRRAWEGVPAAVVDVAVVEENDDDDDDDQVPAPVEMNDEESSSEEESSRGGGAAAASSSDESFIPSDKFSGAKAGYAFRVGDRGLGYYVNSSVREVTFSGLAKKTKSVRELEDRKRRASTLPRKKKQKYERMEQRQQKRERKQRNLKKRAAR